jgi:hypothetical protein
LTEYESRVLPRTPMETIEILGIYYVPREGLDPTLAIVVQNLVLGWYDALRYASESERVEIVNNEGFFKKAFMLGGPQVTERVTTFLKEHPERVSRLVSQGISFAEKFRETPNYERRWPTAYGIERLTCTTGGPCTLPTAMPKEQWDTAWAQAKQRVIDYFAPPKPD